MSEVADAVETVRSILPGSDPKVKRPQLSLIEEARNAVCIFLREQPDVKEVNVVKLVQIDSETGSWEAEAEVYVPNATIRALGLPVRKAVLDCHMYLLRLDGRLNIVAYGLKDSVANREE